MTDYDRLSEEEKQLLLYLLDHQQIVRKEAVHLLKLGETKIKEVFKDLLDKELIERKGKSYFLHTNQQLKKFKL